MTFSEYKEKVSIVHILEDLGYVPDISKGRITPVYVKIINGKKVDEVMVKKPEFACKSDILRQKLSRWRCYFVCKKSFVGLSAVLSRKRICTN